MVELIKCLDCPKIIEKHRHNHERCAICSHAYQTAKSTEKARLRRLAAKEKQAS